DGARHGQTVELEGGEEQVQQAGVVGILHVLDIELPVVVHVLGIAPEESNWTTKEALDVLRHTLPQPGAQWRHVCREGGKYQPVKHLDPQALQVMRRKVKIRCEVSLPAHPMPESHNL